VTTNQSPSRTVRVKCTDLAFGDVVVTSSGEEIGTVNSIPHIDMIKSRVVFLFKGADRPVRWSFRRAVYIKIPRRTV
jgi:hypothetical protein